MRRLWHWIAHLMHWNYGTVETWWDGRALMVGFKCSGCGKMSGVHRSYSQPKYDVPPGEGQT